MSKDTAGWWFYGVHFPYPERIPKNKLKYQKNLCNKDDYFDMMKKVNKQISQ
ncbi:MAG: hypothetical protein KAS17_04235 [Victivallaceae bacterium]|nr:hypothetical protein [Victivallaceae bacterium]